MKTLSKPSQDALILIALVAVGLFAAVFERGPVDGLKLAGGGFYVGCVMALGFVAWRAIAQRRLRLTVIERCLAIYAVAYAFASLGLGWSFVPLTLLGLAVPIVTLSVFALFSRLGWWN